MAKKNLTLVSKFLHFKTDQIHKNKNKNYKCQLALSQLLFLKIVSILIQS